MNVAMSSMDTPVSVIVSSILTLLTDSERRCIELDGDDAATEALLELAVLQSFSGTSRDVLAHGNISKFDNTGDE